MAPAKRRSSNRNSLKAPLVTAADTESPLTTPIHTPEPTANDHDEHSGAPEEANAHDDDDSEQRCPACTDATRELMHGSRKENWIECDNCNTWYHWRCVGNGEDVRNIAKW